MGLTMPHDEASELLGAWALDACEADEAMAVERHVESCDACRREADVLRRSAAWLGEAVAGRLPPLPGASALDDAVTSSSPAALFGHQVHALTALLGTISSDEWMAATPAGWTVHELVAHLLAGASYINWQLGLVGADPGGGEQTWLPRSEAMIAGQRGNAPALTASDWRAQADLLHEHLTGASADELAVRLPWFGRDTPLGVVAVIHAFETWIHAEDIRQAARRPPEAPRPADLASMSGLAVDLLASALADDARARGKIARLVLTGPAGGELTVPPGRPAATADVTLTADMVTFCRLVGGRVPPADFPHEAEGDPELARVVVETAASFAFP